MNAPDPALSSAPQGPDLLLASFLTSRPRTMIRVDALWRPAVVGRPAERPRPLGMVLP